jgi:RND family efflux transporter MFP subunit
VLRAPWAGTVVAVNAEPGENVAPGRRIVTLSGSGALEVEIQVPESVASQLSEGADVVVRFPASRREPVTGRIERVSRDTFGAGALFPVTIALPKRDDIVAGLSVRAELDLGVDNTLLVPVAAVVDPGGQRPTVHRIVDGRAERLEIDVHGLEGERVAVTGALVAGDRVVVGGQRGLLQGELVEVVP